MNIVEKIFPKQCLICSRIGFDICPKCLVKIPHSLPSCCICKNLNNNYYTHKYCLNVSVQCFTGWYIPKELICKLHRKKELQIYSVHKFLLNSLISYLNINELVNDSKIYPLPSKDIQTKRLNISLAKSVNGKSGKKMNILFVGERVEEIENITKQKGLLFEKSPSLQVLTLFTQIPPLKVPLE